MSQRIVLTTTATVPNREIKEVVDIVSAEVAVGMNIFKDIFSAVRDVVGGRAGAARAARPLVRPGGAGARCPRRAAPQRGAPPPRPGRP